MDRSELVKNAAEALKKVEQIKAPEWALFVKTGVHKERPPVQKDWWHYRAAAVLLSVEKLGPIGVSKLRTKYGGKRNRGYKTEHHFKGSGNIIRKVLQQLEAAGLVAQNKKGRVGRVLTPKGKAFVGKLDGSGRTTERGSRAAAPAA